MEMNLAGKTVVITGGGTGIGKAAALEFLKEGCRVAICGRRVEKLKQTRDEYQALGYELMIQSVDVTDYSALAAFADAVEKAYGSIDVWVNNAGSNHIKGLMDYDVEEFRAMTDSILVSVFSGQQDCRGTYAENRKGRCDSQRVLLLGGDSQCRTRALQCL